MTFFPRNKRIDCRLYLKILKELIRVGPNQQKPNNPNTLSCEALFKLCSRDLSEDALWFCSSQLENRECHRKYLPLRLLWLGELLVSLGWNKQKLLLTDCHETACKQLDSNVFAQEKKKKSGAK